MDKAVGRSENPGVTVLFGGHNLPPPLGLDRVNYSAKIWGCHGTPSTPRDDTPAVGFYTLKRNQVGTQCNDAYHPTSYHHALNWQYTKTPKYTLINFHDFLKIWQLRVI